MEILMRSLDQPDLTMLQALLLLCLHAAGAGKGAQAWMLGGMAFRLCTALRLDRVASADDSTTTWHDQEMMRRTYWTAFLVDRFSGAGSEAPFTMSTEYATLPLPTTERCFLENSMITNPGLFDQYSMDQGTSSLGSFAFTIRLSEIWGRLARYANHPQREPAPHHGSSTYTILKQELDAWFTSLPEYLKFSSKTLAAAVHSGEAGALAFMVCLNDRLNALKLTYIIVYFVSRRPNLHRTSIDHRPAWVPVSRHGHDSRICGMPKCHSLLRDLRKDCCSL